MFIRSQAAAAGALAALLALAAGAPAADAPPPTIDRALRKNAAEVLDYLRDQKVKRVGVLKFRVQQGDGPLRDDVGALNRTLADRTEVALTLALTDADKLVVLTKASDVAADSGMAKLTHATEDGRALFFDHMSDKGELIRGLEPIACAWGTTDKAKADAFVTGEARVAPDQRSVRLRLQVFTANHPETLKTVCEFTAAVDPRTLGETGVTFVRSRGAKDDDADTPQQDVAKLTHVFTPPPAGAPPPPPDTQKELQKDWDAALKDSPVQLEILYGGDETRDGDPQPIAAGEVATPKSGAMVKFRLKNVDPDPKAVYGVVLKVNGLNTIEMETAPPIECHKWVLKHGKEVTLKGFQKGKNDAAKFEVLAPEESRADAVNYGNNAGVISMVVFRAVRDDDAGEDAFVKNDAKRNEDAKPISRGSLVWKDDKGKPMRPRDLTALQDQLAKEADPDKATPAGERGLIVPGKIGGSEITPVDFTAYPREVASVVIRYYQPSR